MLNDFSFTVPQEIIFGVGSLKKLPDILKKNKAKKVLLISDRGLEKLGVVEKVSKIVTESGLEFESFLDVEANPSCETVDAATALYKDCGATALIALGGGSPMDVAKAVGVLAVYGGSITEYEGAAKVPGKIVPIIAIPTTAGTGSETTPFVVITDRSKNYKLTVFSYETIPAYALLDPDMITSLPPHIAASTGIDALIHAVESYISKWASPFSDAMGEKAMELIGKNIRPFVSDRSNVEAASAMLQGSMFAGIAFGWARLGNTHAMAHPLGGFFNVPHGVANAVLLPTVLEYNALADRGRYEVIYNYIKAGRGSLDRFTPDILVDEVKRLCASFNIPKNLTEVGVTADKIHDMSVDAMKSGNVTVNPRHTTLADIEALYTKAM
ncbi:MAG: iron-containing alcohol dehydrogenase [Clostridiales Family XIII bacterium]|jgi:alcohol dehydrogenase|nr:iron-containing alcohol dehydrogenase [Clostridiales Family XIII bacterium]